MQRNLTIAPCIPLRPYITAFIIDEKADEACYKVLPTTSMVVGFQFSGRLSLVSEGAAVDLAPAGITGLSDTYKVFKNSGNTGTILVLFSETGASAFFDTPAHELFKGSYSLDNFVGASRITEVEERLSEAKNDNERIALVEHFFLSLLKHTTEDRMVLEAIRLIKEAGGNIRMLQLADQLNISPGRMEKRFRSVVGATPKKFASIVRLRTILDGYQKHNNLTDLGYLAGYFDQAHFIRSFKTFTGLTPEQYFK